MTEMEQVLKKLGLTDDDVNKVWNDDGTPSPPLSEAATRRAADRELRLADLLQEETPELSKESFKSKDTNKEQQ